MLTGHESLKRVIGKRRRFLPILPRLLSPPPSSPSSSNAVKEEEYKTVIKKDELIKEESVTCPVCGSKIRGDDYSVNSHLDLCLVRGTKRKMSQRTLLQFSFSSNVISKKCTSDTVSKEFQISPVSGPKHNDLLQLTSVEADEVTSNRSQCEMASLHANSPCKSSVDILESITQHHAEVHVENKMVDDLLMSSNSVASDFDLTEGLNILSGTALETYIVGRKFGDAAEIISETRICILRDPDNIKDPNAIKVVSPDSGSLKVLGYLPREFAQYLSPVIDRYQLNFEGVVTAVPKTSLDVVPIEITCLQTPSYNEVVDDDIPALKSFCEYVFRSINCGKKCPPTATKYQQNFHCMIKEALKSNIDLFTDAEKSFFESFSFMSDDGQRLFVRLYTRKGPWFRMSNLSYPEILDYKAAVHELSEASYVCSFDYKSEVNDDDLQEILNILTVSELSDILRVLKKGRQDSKVGMRKKDLIKALHSSYRDGLCPLLPNLVLDRTGTCMRISSDAESLFWRIQRLFFLDGEQDLSAFLLVDLGKVKYPEYECDISDPVFSARSDLLALEEAIEVAQIMDQSLDEDKSELVLRCVEFAESQLLSYLKMNLPPKSGAPFLKCFSASWVYSKITLLGVSYYEQEHRYQDAIKLLKLLLSCFTSGGRRGYWTLRLSIDLEHVGSVEESLSVAEVGVLDPWVRSGSKMALQRRVIRLGKPPRRWKAPSYAASVKRKITEVHIQGRPLNSKVGTKSRFYGEDGEQCGVEELALQFYAGEGGGWQGVHTESGIWLTIYGLLMWDIIFSDVPNVFRTKFQNAPLDMDCDDFYVARRSIIESHLQKIHEGLSEAILIMSWESHSGTVCRGVNWERHSLSELRAAVTCIGGPCLANLCRHLAQDYRSWSSGMPDLLLWRFHGDYNGEAKLVEVKGPRDRLSEQQRAWLLTLIDCGFMAEVCKVDPSASA